MRESHLQHVVSLFKIFDTPCVEFSYDVGEQEWKSEFLVWQGPIVPNICLPDCNGKDWEGASLLSIKMYIEELLYFCLKREVYKCNDILIAN